MTQIMKCVTHSLIAVQCAVLLLGQSLLAVAEVSVPFAGRFRGGETSQAVFPLLYVDGEVAGNASHLGRFKLDYDLVVDLTTISSSGTAELIAANGDSLFAEVLGQATVVGPEEVSIVEEYTIIDGTGRFEGATGSFTLRRHLLQTTGRTEGEFAGVLILARGRGK